MATRTTAPTAWVGPIAFAGVMICVTGLFNLITGLAAVFSDKVYLDAGNTTLVLDVTGWGWVHLFFGAGLLAVGVALLGGKAWARLAAAAMVSLNMTTHLLLMPAYPFWSMVTIALDVIVLYALLEHGDEVPRTLS